MNVDTIKSQFIVDTKRFLSFVESHALGDDPARHRAVVQEVAKFEAAWNKPVIVAIDDLVRMDIIIGCIDKILIYVADVDVARVSIRAGVSDTTRGIMARAQLELADRGNKLRDEINAHVTHILKTKPLDPMRVYVLISGCIQKYIEGPIKNGDVQEIGMGSIMGPIMARVARRYVPHMQPEEREELRAQLVDNVASRILDVAVIPIDPTRPIYEQILTTGTLIPLTASMNRNALFEIFGHKYDMGHTMQENLAYLATKCNFNVVLVSKIVRNPIEFDSRILFDYAYVKRNRLMVPKFLGLCDTLIQRFSTVRVLSESKASASIAQYFYHESAANRRAKTPRVSTTLVLETLTGNLFRILGDAMQARKNDKRGGARGSEVSGENYATHYPIDNSQCKFLTRGQSTRADNYHRIAEDKIIASGRSDEVRAIANIFQAAKTDMLVADSLRSKITIDLRTYIREKWHENQLSRADDVFDICAHALQNVLPQIRAQADVSFLSFFMMRIFKLAGRLFAGLVAHENTLLVGDYNSVERVIETVISNAASEELFTMDESLNMAYLRARANPSIAS